MAAHCAPADTAVVRVSGEDAATFLQGQCTADLRAVSLVDALWLNRKGRVLAHTVVSKEADGTFLLLAPRLTAAALIAVVTANVIADDVIATDESAGWRRWVAWGEIPTAGAARVFATQRFGVPAWDVLTPAGAAAPATLAALAELEALLAELPGIFERKFSQRLEPILERQRLLSADNERVLQGSPREEPLVLPLQPAQPRMGSRVRALWPQNQDPSVAA